MRYSNCSESPAVTVLAESPERRCRMNAETYNNLRLIHKLDPESDYLRIYQLTAFYDFPRDMRDGLTLAFYRVFAIPRIAQLLVSTGEMTRRPAKRSYDTGLERV